MTARFNKTKSDSFHFQTSDRVGYVVNVHHIDFVKAGNIGGKDVIRKLRKGCNLKIKI